MQAPEFNPSFFLRFGHLQTLLSTRRRLSQPVDYRKERISTREDDFLDLYWLRASSPRLAILCHGLEGSSDSKYMLGMAAALKEINWDVLAWNYRSCGEEINRSQLMYHAGATQDLDLVFRHALNSRPYAEVLLIGFSLGGNLALLYASEDREKAREHLKGVISFSAPLDLGSSAKSLSRGFSRIYQSNFLRLMKRKVKRKSKQFPGIYRTALLDKIRTLEDFDENYIAPIHGFKSARDYWQRCSSKHRLKAIAVPTLLVSALDDPFLGPECYLEKSEVENPNISLLTPRFGGHSAFMQCRASAKTWSEIVACEFAKSITAFS